MELREHRDHRSSANAKQSLMDIKLFLETPITFYQEQGWWALDPEGELPKRTKSEVMLFFKHYDPDKQVIRLVDRRVDGWRGG
jgi:hypothetical protein